MPCKCVFSLAKKMDTTKQNQISPVLIEAIQLLKFSLKTKHLNFMEGHIMSEVAINEALMPSCNLDFLFADDPNTVLNKILKEFGNYDCETASIDTPPK
jgi:hypothetical protein